MTSSIITFLPESELCNTDVPQHNSRYYLNLIYAVILSPPQIQVCLTARQIQICLSLNFLLYTKIMNMSTRRLLTSITREIGGFFVSKKIFSRNF